MNSVKLLASLTFLLVAAPPTSTDLAGAIRHGSLPEVQAAVEQGAPVNPPEGQNTPLMVAATRGHAEIARYLLDRGAHLNARDAQKRTALFAAIYGAKAAVWDLLLERGADVSLVSRTGDSALDYAVERGQLEAVRALVARKADVNRPSANNLHLGDPPIARALQQNRRDIVEVLLASGARLDYRNADGQNALRAAVAGGNPELVQLCVSKGLDLRGTDAAGRTALIWAAQDGSRAMVEWLLGQGLDAGARNAKGKTAADLAVGPNRPAILQLLKTGGK